MFYAVIHRPEIDTKKIEEVRSTYDPYFKLIDAHITLVFPFDAAGIEMTQLNVHVQNIANQTKQFRVQLNTLELAWDQWLFLTTTKGKVRLCAIHDELYTGVLKGFLRDDIKYIPHIGLGHFAIANSGYTLKDPAATHLDEDRYTIARAEIEAKQLDFTYTATAVELISVNDEFTKTEILASFSFKD